MQLALATSFPWICRLCYCLSDGNSPPIPFENVMAEERRHLLAFIRSLRTIETPKTLLKACENVRTFLATGSDERYAWANVSPELLRELWGVMEKIGGIVPPRPEMLLKGKGKPLVSEWFIQEVLEAIGVIVSWCEAKIAANASSKTLQVAEGTVVNSNDPGNLLQLDGGIWRVRFEKETGCFPDRSDSVLYHLARLLAEPNRRFDALEFHPPQHASAGTVPFSVETPVAMTRH
jgi:hypothetical protein